MKTILAKLTISSILLLTTCNAIENDKVKIVINNEKVTINDMKEILGDFGDFSKLPKDKQQLALDKTVEFILFRQEAVKQVTKNEEYNKALKTKKEQLAYTLWIKELKKEANVKYYTNPINK